MLPSIDVHDTFLATVVWALPSFQRLVPSQSARDLSLPGRCSHLSRDKWAFDGRCSGVRRQGRDRVRRAETAVQDHVWSPSDKEIFQGSALNTGQLTRQCQGSRRLPGLCLRLPSSRQCLNPPYAAQPSRRTRRRRHVKPCSGPTNTLFHHGPSNRTSHIRKQRDQTSGRRQLEAIRRACPADLPGAEGLGRIPESFDRNIESTDPIPATAFGSSHVNERTRNLEVFYTQTSFMSER
jgi:hypothetical protein